MREITTHQIDGRSDLKICAPDKDKIICDSSLYWISSGSPIWQTIEFQFGPIKEFGINGITSESLIAIMIDRLEIFQEGCFACDENQEALAYLRLALTALTKRTKDREARGVEGKSVK